MDVLIDGKIMTPLLVGAVLALVGGIITQATFWLVSLRHAKKTLVIALRAELKMVREDLGTTLAGYRDSLRANDPPKIDVFSLPSPVFDANAANLGQLRDNDLVEHVVEAYSALHRLRSHSDSLSNVGRSNLDIRDFNEMHMLASTTHVQVIKLHNTLSGVAAPGQINRDSTEVESREFTREIHDQLAKGNINGLLQKRWAEA